MKLIRKPSSKDGWYEISPSDAQNILDEKFANRALSEAKAVKIAGEIKAGRFGENGETLIFNETGKLMDGQHRMRGVVLANRAIVSYCVFDIKSKLFATIDDCSKRTAGDVLGINGFSHSMVCAAMARWLANYEAGINNNAGTGTVSLTNRQAVEVLKKNPDIHESALFVVNLNGLSKVVSASIAGFTHMMAARIDKAKADEFFTMLASGENLKRGNPILVLRNKFSGERDKMPPRHKVAYIIKAWNAHKVGKEIKMLKYGGRNAGESFPQFNGVGEEE